MGDFNMQAARGRATGSPGQTPKSESLIPFPPDPRFALAGKWPPAKRDPAGPPFGPNGIARCPGRRAGGFVVCIGRVDGHALRVGCAAR